MRYVLLLLLANPVAHGERLGGLSGSVLTASALGPLACLAVVGLWMAGVRACVGRQKRLGGR